MLHWHDGREPTDALAWLPDLVLVGWMQISEDVGAATPPTDTVEVARLVTSGEVVVYLLDPLGEPWLADQDEMWEWARAGIASMIVDGVAAEDIAQQPVTDTPSDLT